MVVAGSALAHAVGSGSVTVSLTGPAPSALKVPELVKIPEPLMVPVGGTAGGMQSGPEDKRTTSLPGEEALSNLKDITVTQAKR